MTRIDGIDIKNTNEIQTSFHMKAYSMHQTFASVELMINEISVCSKISDSILAKMTVLCDSSSSIVVIIIIFVVIIIG